MNKYYNPKQMKNAEQVTVTIMTKGYGKFYKEYKEVIDFLENKIKIIDKAIEYIEKHKQIAMFADLRKEGTHQYTIECDADDLLSILRGKNNGKN